MVASSLVGLSSCWPIKSERERPTSRDEYIYIYMYLCFAAKKTARELIRAVVMVLEKFRFLHIHKTAPTG